MRRITDIGTGELVLDVVTQHLRRDVAISVVSNPYEATEQAE